MPRAVRRAARSFRFARLVRLGDALGYDVIQDFLHAPTLGGIGISNVVEVRAADSLFQVFVNGTLTSSIVDATFGFGQFGWGVSSQSHVEPAAIVLEQLELARVV